MKVYVKEMCLEVAFKTGKSLSRSDGLRETVPDHRTATEKSSSKTQINNQSLCALVR